MAVPYDLTCWYLNARRILELTGPTPPNTFIADDDSYARSSNLSQLKKIVVDWMQACCPEPLGVLLANNKLTTESLFTHHSDYYFVGLGKVGEARAQGKTVKPAKAYSKLEDWQTGAKVTFDFHDEHLTSTSSLSVLKGHTRVFVLGLATDIKGTTIKSIPYVIANIVDPLSPLPGFAGPWWNHLEVSVEQIDTFSAIRKTEVQSQQSLKKLKNIPERKVKTAFAEIIGEPNIPKDWGGESSDLFTSRLMIENQRISTAFLLKGPSRFHSMTPADLGKNGDQIGRLFDEPADFLVLQHCHEVGNAVRRQMRAYAQQMGNPRKFCIIDGYDTLRILTAYNKCGL